MRNPTPGGIGLVVGFIVTGVTLIDSSFIRNTRNNVTSHCRRTNSTAE